MHQTPHSVWLMLKVIPPGEGLVNKEINITFRCFRLLKKNGYKGLAVGSTSKGGDTHSSKHK